MSILIENCCKTFRSVPVLKNVSLQIDDHEIVVLMGPSGCGKTTLIRCLCDLETPDSGRIMIHGKTLFDQQKTQDKALLKQIHQEVGLVFQNYQLFPHRTVLQNLCDAVLYQRLLSRDEAHKKALALLSQLQLLEKADVYPSELSGGQKQRVAIARACMLKPRILCFDEPTSALDQASIQQLFPILQRLRESMAVLIITHDQEFGKQIATRTILMKEINAVS